MSTDSFDASMSSLTAIWFAGFIVSVAVGAPSLIALGLALGFAMFVSPPESGDATIGAMPDLTRQQWIDAFLAELATLRDAGAPMTRQYAMQVASQQWDLHGSDLEPTDAAFLWHTEHPPA